MEENEEDKAFGTFEDDIFPDFDVSVDDPTEEVQQAPEQPQPVPQIVVFPHLITDDHGVSLREVENEEHKERIRRFNERKSNNSKREVQSEVNFFKQMKESQEYGQNLRNEKPNLKNVPLRFYYFFFVGIDSICKFNPVQRSLKIGYNINTFISNYKGILRPFLDTFILEDTSNVTKNGSNLSLENAFAAANSMADNIEVTEEGIKGICQQFVASVEVGDITNVIFTRSGNGIPIFIPIQKTGKGENKECILVDKTIEERNRVKAIATLSIPPVFPVQSPDYGEGSPSFE